MTVKTAIPELAEACGDERLLAGRAMRDHCEALRDMVEVMDAHAAVSLLVCLTGILTRAVDRQKRRDRP